MRRAKPAWRLLAVLLCFGLATATAACSDEDDGEEGVEAGEETTTTEGEDDGEETTTTEAEDDGGLTENEGRTEGDGTLQVGTLLPVTGDLSVLGPPMVQGVNMAIRDINDAGGVLGQPVALTETDDGTNEDVASASVDQLLAANVDAIIGAASSRITLSVIDKITGGGTVECSPSNTGSNLTTYEDRGLYFRTAPADDLQGQALADVIAGDGHTSVAILALNDEYGQGFAGTLSEVLEEGGVEIVEDVAYDPDGTAFDADVQQIADAGPEAVALIGFPQTGGVILKSMIEQGIGPDDVAIYVTDGMQSNTLFEQVDPDDPSVTEGIRGTAPSAAPEDGAEFFPDAFAEFAPGVDTIFSAHAYDCMIVIALAAGQAESDAPADIAANINSVTKGGEKCSTYADCLELLGAGEDIDYDGAAGALDFVEAGEPGAGTYDAYTFGADGTYTTDEQIPVG
jgi:ABC-type branched-subunit amino acid transport system substrate-binding protein